MDNSHKLRAKLLNNMLDSTTTFHSTFNLEKLSNLTPQNPSTIYAKGDSSASQHYFILAAASQLKNVHHDPHGHSVMPPDKSIIKSTHKEITFLYHSSFLQNQPQLHLSQTSITTSSL